MSNQIPNSWDAPASPQPGISKISSGTATALADALDARSTALEGVAGTGAEIAAQAKTDITTAALGYDIGGDLVTAINKAGTAIDSALGRLAKTAKSDAQTVRSHVSGRQGTEKDTEKKLDDAAQPEGTTYV